MRPEAGRPLRGHRPLPRRRRAARDQAAEGARRPPRGRADRDRPDDRRRGRRRRGGRGPGRGPARGRPDQAERRLRDPARQPRARRLRGEAVRARPHGAQRPGARVRARGGRVRRCDGEGDPARRRGRDPQRGSQGRPRHARDAARDRRARRGGTRRQRRAPDRRPLLGSDPRLHGRPRGARGARRRPDRGDPGRRHGRVRRREARAQRGALGDEEIAERVAAYEPPDRRPPNGVLGKYRKLVGSAPQRANAPVEPAVYDGHSAARPGGLAATPPATPRPPAPSPPPGRSRPGTPSRPC